MATENRANVVEDPEFDEHAENYDAALAQGIAVSGEDKNYFARGRVEWLEKQLAKLAVKPQSVMDFGCGTGSATPFFFEILNNQTVLGVDISQKSLDVATREFGSDTAKFQSLAVPQPVAAIDLAFSNGTFHHIPIAERAGAVTYIYNALKPGGLFALWENSPWNLGTRYVMSRCPFDKDAITLTPPETRGLVQAGGFEVIQTDFLFIFPRFLSLLRPIEPHVSRLPLGTQYLVLCRKMGGSIMV